MAVKRMFAPLPGGGSRPARREGEWCPLWPVPGDAPAAPEAHPTLGKPVAVYEYRAAAGELGGYVWRLPAPDGRKEFRPLTFCTHSTSKERAWRWKSHTPLRPLYGLDRLAARPDAPVVVAEGEKAADAAGWLLPGYVAVTSPGGSNGAGKADWGMLARRRVVVWPDADEAGGKYAVAVARALALAVAEVAIVAPPAGVAEGWDAADAEAEGWDEARVLALVEAATPAREAMRAEHDGGGGSLADGGGGKTKTTTGASGSRRGDDDGGPPQRDRLIAVLRDAELWHSGEREAFASVVDNGHVEHMGVRSRDFRIYLAGRYFDATGGAAGGQAVEDALRVIEAKAIHHGPCYATWRRVGERDGVIYLDLCDVDWRAVEVAPDGWKVIDAAPIKFLRSPAMRPLPAPEAGESVDLLRGFINVETGVGDDADADYKLVVAWLVAALRPCGPYPILIIGGEQGSAKSLTMRLLRSLVDPNLSPNRAEPREERDLMIAAHNAGCITLDNVSKVPAWLSDALCRLSTGGGFATRELHSDKSEIVLDAQRPIILNGIPDLAARPDLGDRSIAITLPAIPEDRRRVETEFLAEFEAARPAILGALLDAVSSALRNLPTTRLERLPRMADFALWIVAAEAGLGWEAGSFLRAYADNRSTAVQTVVANNAVAQAIEKLLTKRAAWEGTASELLPMLDNEVMDTTRAHRSWPATASALGVWLARLAPALRAVGVEIRNERQGKDRRRVWVLGRVEDA